MPRRQIWLLSLNMARLVVAEPVEQRKATSAVTPTCIKSRQIWWPCRWYLDIPLVAMDDAPARAVRAVMVPVVLALRRHRQVHDLCVNRRNILRLVLHWFLFSLNLLVLILAFARFVFLFFVFKWFRVVSLRSTSMHL